MARIRAFENAAEEASKGGVAAFGSALGAADVRGPLHLSTGQEAVPAGVCANLAATDAITSTHRGHGHTIAKGASLERMMCELFGRASGSNGGKGGSMHIADFSVGMLGANGVVAAGIPIAVGAAHAYRITGSKAVIACFFGDGAINRGPFLEGLNWAKIHALPVLFVCEDNRYSATTSTEAMTAGPGALARAPGDRHPRPGVRRQRCGSGGCRCSGAARPHPARGGAAVPACGHLPREGPCLGGSGRLPRPGEVERALEQDPLALARAKFVSQGIAAAALDRIVAERGCRGGAGAARRGRRAASRARRGLHRHPGHRGGPMALMSYAEAGCAALAEAMRADARVVALGEDVGRGGIFGQYKGLAAEFGAVRVIDTPISEATIMGAAVGMALAGLKPVVEMRVADFALCAMDELVNQAAKARYMFGGQGRVPLVARLPIGIWSGSAAQHGQSFEAWFAHVPGLVVVAPATPADNYALLAGVDRLRRPGGLHGAQGTVGHRRAK